MDLHAPQNKKTYHSPSTANLHAPTPPTLQSKHDRERKPDNQGNSYDQEPLPLSVQSQHTCLRSCRTTWTQAQPAACYACVA